MPKTLRQLKQDYLTLLEDLNANLRAQLEQTPGLAVPGRPQGAVYVLRQADTNNYKIGFSTNYPQRKALFDVKLPFIVDETLVHYTEHYRELERALHAHFADQRLNNSEFFNLNDADVAGLPQVVEELTDRIALDKEQRLAAQTESSPDPADENDKDAELITKAKSLLSEFLLTPQEISVSFIQRKLSIGYARAGRLKDRLLAETAE